MIDYRQTEIILDNAINFAENYRNYFLKMKAYELFRSSSYDDHIYEYYKMIAYYFKGKAEGLRLIVLCLGKTSDKMIYLDALLRV